LPAIDVRRNCMRKMLRLDRNEDIFQAGGKSGLQKRAQSVLPVKKLDEWGHHSAFTWVIRWLLEAIIPFCLGWKMRSDWGSQTCLAASISAAAGTLSRWHSSQLLNFGLVITSSNRLNPATNTKLGVLVCEHGRDVLGKVWDCLLQSYIRWFKKSVILSST